MEVSYKRDYHHSYLILQEGELPDCDTYAIRMLLNSSVPGLLPCSVHNIDNQALFYYDVTSKQTLEWVLEHQKVDRELLILVMGALIRTMEEMEAYLLDTKMLLLSLDYIYLNASDREIGFVCWPGNHSVEGSVQQLMEQLLPRIDHKDQDAVVLGYQLYREAMEEQLEPEKIRKTLYQEMVKPEIAEEPIVEANSSQQEIFDAVLKHVEEEEKKEKQIHPGICLAMIIFFVVIYLYLMRNRFFSWVIFAVIAGVFALGGIVSALVWWLKKRKSEKPISDVFSMHRSEEELPDIMEEAQTTLLYADSIHGLAKLMPIKPAHLDEIVLKPGVQILGKLEGAADLILPSPAISRVHAKIVWEEECKIYDLNSRNGTYVNYEAVSGMEGRILKDGDYISFADLVYRYTRHSVDLRPIPDSTIMREDSYRRFVNGAAVLSK